jgi:hypothetical protein
VRLVIDRDIAVAPQGGNDPGWQDIERLSAQLKQHPTPPDVYRKLVDATAQYIAGEIPVFKTTSSRWQSDLLSPADLSNALEQCQAEIKRLVQCPVEELLIGSGVAPPLAAIAGGIGANFALAPANRLIGTGTELLDIVGICVGAATGLHPLLIASAKHLAGAQAENAVVHLLSDALGGRQTLEQVDLTGPQVADVRSAYLRGLHTRRHGPSSGPAQRSGPGAGPGISP